MVGTVWKPLNACERRVRSQFPKKKALFFLIGPP